MWYVYSSKHGICNFINRLYQGLAVSFTRLITAESEMFILHPLRPLTRSALKSFIHSVCHLLFTSVNSSLKVVYSSSSSSLVHSITLTFTLYLITNDTFTYIFTHSLAHSFWVGVCARFSKPWPYFRPKRMIFHTPLQTWRTKKAKIIPYFRLKRLENHTLKCGTYLYSSLTSSLTHDHDQWTYY